MDTNVLFLRIKSLCEERDITVAQLERELKIGGGTISKWKTANPTIDKVMAVAQYFRVTVDYLCGLSDSWESVDRALADEDIVTFQRAASKMTIRDKEKAMQILKLGFEYAFCEENSTERRETSGE